MLDCRDQEGSSIPDEKSQDITHMENEKSQLTKRVERLKQKGEQIINFRKVFDASQSLRQEI
jgi:hypothetical protein